MSVTKRVVNEIQNEAKEMLDRVKPDFIKKYLTERASDESKAKPDFILNFNNENILKWDTLILLMAIWNCI